MSDYRAGMMEIMQLVKDERQRQEQKWGEQNHEPLIWMAILAEEFGEACKAVLEGDDEGYTVELIHVAAVAIAAAECWERIGSAALGLPSIVDLQQQCHNLAAENAELKGET